MKKRAGPKIFFPFRWLCVVVAVLFFSGLAGISGAAELEIPSTFTPVGSGARAIGMGSAFIAVADDATAASWNPGGLIRLIKPEMSLVADTCHRRESLVFETHPEASGAKNINTFDLNFFSATLPLNLFRRNMVFSVGYQRLFDFNRHWQFLFTEEETNADSRQYWDFEQEGSLSALGVSFCIQIIPQLAVGATFNRWEPGIGENRWEQNYSMTGSGTAFGEEFTTSLKKRESFSFSAVNANFGFYWRVADGFTLGGVVKTPVEGDVRHTYRRKKPFGFPATLRPIKKT